MRNILVSLAAAGAMLVPATAALAQARASVLVVDTGRIGRECTACKAAGTAINGQITTARARAQTLGTQWQTEERALETAVAALAGKQPDAALSQRIQRYQASRQQGQTELQQSEARIQSIEANVQQQLANRIVLISEQVRVRRQADIVIAKNSTLASNSAGDITAEVLTALNQQLPSVSVTPLPQQQQAAPAGR